VATTHEKQTKAARLHRHGEPLVVEDVALPQPGPGEVLVTLRRAGVNPIDRYVAAGTVATDGPLPRTIGLEAAGEVDGSPVLVHGHGLGMTRDGVYAGHVVAPQDALVPVPDGVPMEQAASASIAGLTAYSVVSLADITADDRVLVLGASGGVGLPVVSRAAGLGARVWGQTGNPAKADAIRELGAVDALITDADELASAATQVRPTVVIDALGGDFTPAALNLIEQHGRYVVFGVSAGPQVTLDLRSLYRRSIHLLGYSGFGLTSHETRKRLDLVLAALADGTMRIPVDRTLALDEITTAFDALADRAVTGKVVLALDC
jgi:NADPH2:quinone reductase